ncbi:MAG: hypothetical protein ACI8QS_000552 [Planctomycetota bacterium]|jgi:hypothetical protein
MADCPRVSFGVRSGPPTGSAATVRLSDLFFCTKNTKGTRAELPDSPSQRVSDPGRVPQGKVAPMPLTSWPVTAGASHP